MNKKYRTNMHNKQHDKILIINDTVTYILLEQALTGNYSACYAQMLSISLVCCYVQVGLYNSLKSYTCKQRLCTVTPDYLASSPLSPVSRQNLREAAWLQSSGPWGTIQIVGSNHDHLPTFHSTSASRLQCLTLGLLMDDHDEAQLKDQGVNHVPNHISVGTKDKPPRRLPHA